MAVAHIPSKILFSRPTSQNAANSGLQRSARVGMLIILWKPCWSRDRKCVKMADSQLLGKSHSFLLKIFFSRPTRQNATKFGLQHQARAQISCRSSGPIFYPRRRIGYCIWVRLFVCLFVCLFAHTELECFSPQPIVGLSWNFHHRSDYSCRMFYS